MPHNFASRSENREHAQQGVPSITCSARGATQTMLCKRCYTKHALQEVQYKTSSARGVIRDMLCKRCHASHALQEVLYKTCSARGAIQNMLCKRCHTQHALQEVLHLRYAPVSPNELHYLFRCVRTSPFQETRRPSWATQRSATGSTRGRRQLS